MIATPDPEPKPPIDGGTRAAAIRRLAALADDPAFAADRAAFEESVFGGGLGIDDADDPELRTSLLLAFVLDHMGRDGSRPIERLLGSTGAADDGVGRYLAALRDTAPSVHRIEAVRPAPEPGVQLRCLLTDTVHDIADAAAAETLGVGEIVVARTLPGATPGTASLEPWTIGLDATAAAGIGERIAAARAAVHDAPLTGTETRRRLALAILAADLHDEIERARSVDEPPALARPRSVVYALRSPTADVLAARLAGLPGLRQEGAAPGGSAVWTWTNPDPAESDAALGAAPSARLALHGSELRLLSMSELGLLQLRARLEPLCADLLSPARTPDG